MLRKTFAAATETRMPPVAVSFDRSASFKGRPGHHPFVLLGGNGLDPLRLFRQSLAAALARNGLKQWARPDFNPHVTLLYGPRQVEEQPIEPISWTVREFVLVRSAHGHAHLGRWSFESAVNCV